MVQQTLMRLSDIQNSSMSDLGGKKGKVKIREGFKPHQRGPQYREDHAQREESAHRHLNAVDDQILSHWESPKADSTSSSREPTRCGCLESRKNRSVIESMRWLAVSMLALSSAT
jgi:hypothetical protein